MKIIKEKTLNNSLSYLVAEELITMEDIRVDEWTVPDVYRNEASMFSRVDLNENVIDILKEFSLDVYLITYHDYRDNSFVMYSNQGNIYSHISLTKEFSLSGIRKDNQKSVKDAALNTLKMKTDLQKQHAVEELLEYINNILKRKIEDINNEVLRDTRSMVSNEVLAKWADKEAQEKIVPINKKISEVREALNTLEDSLRAERMAVLQDFVDNQSSEYSSTVIKEIQEAIKEGNVFNPSRFGNF